VRMMRVMSIVFHVRIEAYECKVMTQYIIYEASMSVTLSHSSTGPCFILNMG
jgi:hypothetical protein